MPSVNAMVGCPYNMSFVILLSRT